MNLAQAVETLTAEFPLNPDEKAEAASTLDLTAGGIRADRDVEPALWASANLAVTAWLREAREALRERGATLIRLVDGPHLDKWNMTVTDIRNTHRVAEPRWSVTAKLGLFGTSQTGASDMSSTNSLSERVNKLEDKVFGPKEERDAAEAKAQAGTAAGADQTSDGDGKPQPGPGNPAQQADAVRSSANTAPNPDAASHRRGHGETQSKK